MRKLTVVFFFAVAVAAPKVWGANKQQDRLAKSAKVFHEIMNTPDQGIQADLTGRSACMGIFPSVKKLAFVVGGSHGAGYILCRGNDGKGAWGAPSEFSISGGSFGFRIGGSATDLVLLVMNKEGVEKLLEDQFTLGADASIAAGPIWVRPLPTPTRRCPLRCLATRAARGCSPVWRWMERFSAIRGR